MTQTHTHTQTQQQHTRDTFMFWVGFIYCTLGWVCLLYIVGSSLMILSRLRNWERRHNIDDERAHTHTHWGRLIMSSGTHTSVTSSSWCESCLASHWFDLTSGLGHQMDVLGWPANVTLSMNAPSQASAFGVTYIIIVWYSVIFFSNISSNIALHPLN